MIVMFPCLSDNYGFLLHDPQTGLTASIDAPDATEIARQCAQHNFTLSHIFNTHHHFDHVGGNQMLKEKYGVSIVGPESDAGRIPCLDQAVGDGEVFKFGQFDIHVIDTPGHTLGHCVYYIPALNSAFVGDTLFALGCGRLFEGSPAQMFDSLSKLAALPDETKIYCAHEYTLANGAFALTVDPENEDLKSYMREAKALRDKNLPTVPTTIAREKAANPFMRAKTAEELGRIRALKDSF
ncbi:MAG: hydroxyacylglutathione hydrolase [Robiginitomaculum sp.]|nr:MAG: hydroxyacylglutathione hydrolase [Robiginitomaculum sp.]